MSVIEQFYHDSSSFKLISLADKCADLEFVRNVAADIESKQGRQLRPRVFFETTSSPPGLHYSCSLQSVQKCFTVHRHFKKQHNKNSNNNMLPQQPEKQAQ